MKRSFFYILVSILLLTSCETNESVDEGTGNAFISLNGKNNVINGLGEAGTTVFFMVRHAEKQSDDDPGLNILGADRANLLAEILKDIPLTAIYSTSTKRTRATAEPCAKMKDLQIINYDPDNQNNLFPGIVKRSQGDCFLVIGHSNTIPPLLNLFKGKKVYGDIDENDFDNLYVVIVKNSGDTEIMELKY